MDRIAQVIVAHSRRVLAVTGVVTLVAVAMLFRVDFNADVASFVLEGNETGEQFSALQEKYTAADPINVLVSLPEGETFEDPGRLADLVRLRESLTSTDGVNQVASVVPDVNPLTGQPFTAEMLLAAPPEIVGGLLAENPVADLLLSPDARHTLMLVSPDGDAVAVARTVDDVETPTGFELTFSGNPVVFASVVDLLTLILLVIPPSVIILLVLVFYTTIGDRRLSVLSIIPAALGSVWTFGLIFGLGREVDIVTVIVPIFVIVMGSADGLHFVTHFQDSAHLSDPVERVASALRQVGVPMILTTVSTAAGFLSLTVTDVQPIQQLGLFAAIGIVFAGIISFFSLPALISRLTVEPRHHDALLGPRVVSGLKRLVRTRTPAIVLTIGILVFAGLFVPRLEVNPDQLFFFKDDDPVRVAFEKTEELFGGATPLMGEFVFDPAAGAGQLAEIESASSGLEALPGIRRVFSVADVAGSLSEEQLAAVVSGQQALPVGDMVSADGMRFMVFPTDFDADDLQGWLDYAEDTEAIRVLTGMPVVWDEIARLVLQAQVASLIVAFALVTVMLAIAYRKVRQTLVSLVPILLTVLTLLGFLAASGIQLNLLTAVISSIVIGVGIDYAIHYVAAIDHARAAGEGYVYRALDKAGRPIVANALGIAVGLTALWLSPLKIHSQVSMIMWVSMITAALTALVVIPALLERDGVAGSPTGERVVEPPAR